MNLTHYAVVDRINKLNPISKTKRMNSVPKKNQSNGDNLGSSKALNRIIIHSITDIDIPRSAHARIRKIEGHSPRRYQLLTGKYLGHPPFLDGLKRSVPSLKLGVPSLLLLSAFRASVQWFKRVRLGCIAYFLCVFITRSIRLK